MTIEDRIIFLDFDGVIHPVGSVKVELRDGKYNFSGELLFCWAPVLWQLIEPHNCSIVIHSSWKIHLSLQELKERFPIPMRNRIIGVTENGPRFERISTYVKTNGLQRFLVLDDQPEEFPANWPYLIVCDPELGLWDHSIRDKIISFLAE